MSTQPLEVRVANHGEYVAAAAPVLRGEEAKQHRRKRRSRSNRQRRMKNFSKQVVLPAVLWMVTVLATLYLWRMLAR